MHGKGDIFVQTYDLLYIYTVYQSRRLLIIMYVWMNEAEYKLCVGLKKWIYVCVSECVLFVLMWMCIYASDICRTIDFCVYHCIMGDVGDV